jgi:enterochelin esterase-like enzyme
MLHKLVVLISSALAIFFASVQTGAFAKSNEDVLAGSVHVYKYVSHLVRPQKRHIDREVFVYTPPGYDDPANAQRRYAVVYLLHGAPGKSSNFFLNFGDFQKVTDDMVADHKIVPVILVAPDGNYTEESHGDSEWVNSYDGKDLFENYVANEIVEWTDHNFRTLPNSQHRVIGGVSEGGYAAVNIALHRPEVFSKVLAMSGYYTNDGSGWARPIMGKDPDYIAYNSPVDYISKHSSSTWKLLRIYLGAGTNETHYFAETNKMADELKAHGVAIYTMYYPGKHSWGLWTQLYETGLPQLLDPSHVAEIPTDNSNQLKASNQ